MLFQPLVLLREVDEAVEHAPTVLHEAWRDKQSHDVSKIMAEGVVMRRIKVFRDDGSDETPSKQCLQRIDCKISAVLKEGSGAWPSKSHQPWQSTYKWYGAKLSLCDCELLVEKNSLKCAVSFDAPIDRSQNESRFCCCMMFNFLYCLQYCSKWKSHWIYV